MRRLVSLLLAIYLFNFSIDSRDLNSDAIAEDLSFNDIESFYEFTLEAIIGIEDAVEEHDEHDQEDGGVFAFKKVYLGLSPSYATFSAYLLHEICYSIISDNFIIASFSEIVSPPPKG